jgi:hypothetical protein
VKARTILLSLTMMTSSGVDYESEKGAGEQASLHCPFGAHTLYH